MSRRKQPSFPPEQIELRPGVRVWRCTARRRGTDQRCGAIAVKGRNKCRIHGGRSLSGPAHPRYTTGKYSSVLPPDFRETFARLQADPDLLDLRDDIAVVTGRIEAIMRRAQQDADWPAAQQAMSGFITAMRAGDQSGVNVHMNRLRVILTEQGDADGIWREIMKLIERRAALVEREQRRLQIAHGMMSREQVVHFANLLLGAIHRHVEDRSALSRIAEEFRDLLGGGESGTVH